MSSNKQQARKKATPINELPDVHQPKQPQPQPQVQQQPAQKIQSTNSESDDENEGEKDNKNDLINIESGIILQDRSVLLKKIIIKLDTIELSTLYETYNTNGNIYIWLLQFNQTRWFYIY